MKPPYHVIWKPVVIKRWLANVVADAMEQGSDLSAITSAMSEIERRLARNPAEERESRSDFERFLYVSPLGVTYDVLEEEEIVYILRARYAPPRG